MPLATPVLTIQSIERGGVGGHAGDVRDHRVGGAGARDLDVNLDAGGTATSSDIVTPPSTVTLPTDATSVQVERPDARRQRS